MDAFLSSVLIFPTDEDIIVNFRILLSIQTNIEIKPVLPIKVYIVDIDEHFDFDIVVYSSVFAVRPLFDETES